VRKLAVITGTRADYGILYPLLKEIYRDKDLKLQIIVTGMHLSPEFGLTYKEVEKDGFIINKKVEMLLSSDTPVGVLKSMALGQISLAEVYNELKPDLVVVLGDRFESFAAATAAMISGIPIAHLGGGDTSEGVIDETLRHAITKMSHLHFTITDQHRQKVIQLGEKPNTVFSVGALSIDNIMHTQLFSKESFQREINFKLGKNNVLVAFHPCNLDKTAVGAQFKALLDAVDSLEGTHIIFTKPNADIDGRIIIKMIDEYVAQNQNKAIAFASMGRKLYLSALQFVDVIIGNSSSGLVEAPSFKLAAINIGDRQQGRMRAENIVDCDPAKKSIINALRKVYSRVFQDRLKSIENPYGDGKTAPRIKRILKQYPLKGILKKQFYVLRRLD